MFAVKGWAVPTSALRTQTKPPSEPKKPDQTDDENEASKSQKRKRRKGQKNNVTAENFADLWQQHIEGGAPKQGQEEGHTLSKREKKRQKREDAANNDTEAFNEDALTEKSSGKNKYEKRKQKEETKKDKSQPQASLKDHSVKPLPTQTTRSNGTTISSTSAPLPNPPISTLTPLQASMRQKLISSRFRHLNETLYTTPSSTSLSLFSQNPTFFSEYHEGFRRQVNAWPENPVDGFIRWVLSRGKLRDKNLGSQKAQFRKVGKGRKKGKKQDDTPPEPGEDAENVEPLPRNYKTGICTIADLGCGDGQLAASLTKGTEGKKGIPASKTLKLQIHSYDLASTSPPVTVADISNLPLQDGSVDVAVFSLALMGTNWIEFVEEAYRVLRWKGECWISEVGSRFAGLKRQRVEHSVGNRVKRGAEAKGKGEKKEKVPEEDFTTVEEETAAQASTDVSAFVAVLKRRGFVLQGEPELGNKMFVRMRFLKAAQAVVGKHAKERKTVAKEKKFLDKEDEVSVEDETKVLKPCVYKIR